MRTLLSLIAMTFVAPIVAAEPPKLKVMFLGDNGHHQPLARFKQLQPVLAARNIELTYTDKLEDLNAKTLAEFDGLMIYANHEKITPEQEKALLGFVEGGKGLIPLHCASYCFLNSPQYIALVGAQFRSHGTGTFRTEMIKPEHELMKGFQSFSSWDETYVHTKHNEKDRTVLEIRTDGDLKEPWTWVRTQGKGRVFYTAWGHDQRTWSHTGFNNLVERGVRWACGQDPAIAGSYFDRPRMTELRKDLAPFEYGPAKIPFYPPNKAWGTLAEPINKMQKPLSAEESVKHFVTPVDFEVKLFVSEEKLGGKPIAMAWDEQGRLWVSITVDYPNELQPAGQGHDRIVICEDTQGRGVCDKVTVFADKLSIATSLLPYAGGVIVHQAPHTLFLKDTTGAGQANVRQILFSGWSTGDTHAGPSNLKYGFDNWIYGSVGYAGFNGVVGGERINFRQGFYRFKVEPVGKSSELKVTKLEFLRSTNNNTWGLAFNEEGELFGSTANGCPLVHMPIANRYYEKVKGLNPSVLQNIAPDNHFEPITDKIRQVDWHGGFTAGANCSIYTARTYPREYWNDTAFVSEPTGHLTATFVLTSDGTDYKARYGWNLLASDDEWTAPIEAQVGPDGHMWVIDWYNFIVQHNPTPAGYQTGKGAAYETNLRDKLRGRIYRVVYTKAKPESPFTLKDATPEKLVETLKHPNMTWRLHAQRLLVERAQTDVVPALEQLIANKGGADETGLNAGAIHAIWTLAGLGQNIIPDRGNTTYRDSRGVWCALLRALATSPNLANDNELALALNEKNPAVILSAAIAAADRSVGQLIKHPAPLVLSKSLAAQIRQLGTDTNLRVALLSAASRQPEPVLDFVLHGDAATASGLDAIEQLARLYAQGGGGNQLGDILKACGQGRSELASAVINGLSAGWPASKQPSLENESQAAIAQLLSKLPASSRGRLLKLATIWGVPGLEAQLAEITKGLFGTLADTRVADATRLEAAKQLLEFRPDDDATVEKLLGAITPQTAPALAVGIFEALNVSRAGALGAVVVGKLKDLSPAVRPTALRLVLAKPESARAFLDAVEKGLLRFDMLVLDQRTALASHPDKAVAERASKLLALGGGLPSPDRQKVIDDLKYITTKTGDVPNGKKVFTQHCAKCHKYAGEGNQIGPDLTGMAVHPKDELIIHILDPSRSVEGNYKAYRVVTADDRTIIGLLSSESKTTIEVVDADGKRYPLSRDDVASIKETDKSLMPEGFEKVMKPEELGDLLEFITQKGKYVPIPLDKVATVVTTKDMFFDAGGTAERLIFPDWKPKVFNSVPFLLVDPAKDTTKNAVMLYGPNGKIPPTMPKSVSLPCNTKAKAIHFLSGVSGWGFPAETRGSVSMIVRFTYDDGKTEDHELKNGVHFADYIHRVDVPESQFAFALRNQQIRYFAVTPKRDAAIKTIDLVKGPDRSAPIVMAITVETP
jgi:putative membrane-bound dehydrogenase-like protein